VSEAVEKTRAPQPLICICMATHEPDAARLEVQIESIRAQEWANWVCVISDDSSGEEAYATVRGLTEGDERFEVSRSPAALGFYRNFERALAMAPAEARWVSFADQDDRWYPDKLAKLAAPLADPGTLLAYSDMRIVDESGATLSDTYWILRGNRWDDIVSMLVANTVTGAASMFERDLLHVALPFPEPVADPYHDHWIALCALARGRLAYVDEPTYERTRHRASVTAGTRHARVLAGEKGADAEQGSAGERLDAVYSGPWQQMQAFAKELLARGTEGGGIEAGKERALRRFVAADGSVLAAARLGLRGLRPLVGRDETLGRERALAAAAIRHRFQRS
jgi:glycosyltransferase involved in cell wall biosynthesis